MTDQQREKICAILSGPVESPDPNIQEVLSTIAVAETYDLEPLIDDMLEQAERAGRFRQLLEDFHTPQGGQH